MLAYVFWHAPSTPRQMSIPDNMNPHCSIFWSDLSGSPPAGFESCTTYRISEVPSLDKPSGYEDWYFVRSSADLDALNQAAGKPSRWDVHAPVASKIDTGYSVVAQAKRHVLRRAAAQDPANAGRGLRVRPQDPLEKISDESARFLSC